MNLTIVKGIGGWLRLHYDKIIAVLMLIALCLSLLYLAFKIGMTRKEQEVHARMIESFQPGHPNAVPVDDTPYETALTRLKSPFQIPAWTNALFVPEARVWCIDCRMPIPWAAEACPFCTAKQPSPRESNPLWDYDRDGIPDLWEKKYGMDPNDPRDIFNDRDGDGFSNIVEFMAEPQTDLTDLTKKHGTAMNDAKDYPPPEDLLFVDTISGDPFDLRFWGKVVMPDNSLKFQLNVLGTKPKTVWAKMNDTVEGFTLVDFKEKYVKKQLPSLIKTVDESVLTLKRGEKIIPLQINQLVPYTEYTAKLRFELDGTLYDVKPESLFEIKGREYRVKDIDIKREIVVIIRVSDGKQFDVGKTPANLPFGGGASAPSAASVPAEG